MVCSETGFGTQLQISGFTLNGIRYYNGNDHNNGILFRASGVPQSGPNLVRHSSCNRRKSFYLAVRPDAFL